MNVPNPLDIFLHIPKTAGTTLHNIIWREYAEGVYTLDYGVQTLETFRGLDPAGQAQIRLLTGHLTFGAHEGLQRPTRYFTIMRDPVELVLSFYYYIRSRPDHPQHPLANRLSLPDFIASKRNPDVHNAQTHLIAGGSANLDQAKANIQQHFLLVGLTEQFDQTLLLLRRHLGWQNLHYARMNVTSKRPSKTELSPAVLDAILAANQLDIQLYQFAQARFQEQVAAYGANFQADLATFQRKNRLLTPLMRAYWQGRQRYILASRRLLGRLKGRK